VLNLIRFFYPKGFGQNQINNLIIKKTKKEDLVKNQEVNEIELLAENFQIQELETRLEFATVKGGYNQKDGFWAEISFAW